MCVNVSIIDDQYVRALKARSLIFQSCMLQRSFSRFAHFAFAIDRRMVICGRHGEAQRNSVL
jgi:hypothetical protein